MAMSIYHLEHDDDTHDLYDVNFFEDTILTSVTNTPSYVDSWISDIERIHRRRLHFLVVGLDVEWRPNFGRSFDNPVAILQLCVGRRCLIFQILHSPTIPWSLRNFLRNPSYTFTGVGIDNDVEKLEADYDLEIGTTADIRYLAAEEYGMRELRNAGLKGLTETVLGKEMNKPKSVTVSRWDRERLTQSQVVNISKTKTKGGKIGNLRWDVEDDLEENGRIKQRTWRVSESVNTNSVFSQINFV